MNRVASQEMSNMASKEDPNASTDIMSQLLTATVPNLAGDDTFHNSDYCRTPSRNGNAFDTSDQLIQMSPTPDVFEIRNDNRSLKTKLRQMHADLKTEQDTVSSLRRKINNMERERLDAVASVNQEVSRLDSEVTKYRSQLEKGEAVRQSIEFDLAKAQREIHSERRSAKEREATLIESSETLKQRVNELNTQVEHLKSEMGANKASTLDNTSRLQSVILEKEQVISSAQAEKDILESEKEKLEAVIEQRDITISEMEERIQELEDDKRSQLESLHRHIGENELFAEKEKRLKLDLETASDKIKTLEESIEAERAAHLETKFNSEIVQLRIRDLEGALEIEKKAKSDVMTATDKLNKQLRAEKEHSYVNKHLHNELEEKKHIIAKLSEQLDVHQREFTSLKEELNKARKKQIVVEEYLSGSTKELQILVDNFRSTPSSGKAKKGGTKKKDPSRTQLLSSLLEDMRRILIENKRKVDNLSGDHTRLKQQNEHLLEECSQYKEMLWAKDKTVASVQQNFTRASKDLRKLQTECKERDPVVKQLQQELNETKKLLEAEQKQKSHLNNQITDVVSKYKKDEQSSAEFLHSLFRQLQLVHQIPKIQEVAVQGWGDLAIAVNDQVSALISKTKKMEEKIKKMENALKDNDSSFLSLQKTHEEQLEKLAGLAETRAHQWQLQKADMEKHYSQLLAEIHGRHKKTQSLADQAWEKIRMSGTVQQGLESECSQLRSQLKECRKEHDVLLTTCTLLTSAFYPLYTRNAALAAERHILVEHLNKFDSLKQEIQVLVDALSVDHEVINKGAKRGHGRAGSPLMRFRAAAIAVMGANRLLHGLQNKTNMFTVNDVLPGLFSMTVCTGGLEAVNKPFTGVSNPFILEDEKAVCRPEEFALTWLGNTDFLSIILSTMTDLQSALEKARAGDASYNSQKLVIIAKGTFKKLVCHFPGTFPTLSAEPFNGLREKSSLIRFLSHGLNRALAHNSLGGQTSFASSQNTISALQKHILEFTERLHAAEIERRDLRLEINRLNSDIQTFEQTSDAAQHLRLEVNELRAELDSMVPTEKFEAVCQELNHALSREQQAQSLMNEQSRQIHDLGLQLDVQSGASIEKGSELSKALNREQQAQEMVRDQSKQIHTLGLQIDSLRAELQHRDKKIGDETEACQSLISKYVQSEKHLAGKVSILNEEIHQHKEHISALKRELAAACKREYDDEIESLKLPVEGNYIDKEDTPSRSAFWHSINKDGNFEALREEDDSLPTRLTPKGKITQRSIQYGTPEYKTPQQSQKSAFRRKAGKGKY